MTAHVSAAEALPFPPVGAPLARNEPLPVPSQESPRIGPAHIDLFTSDDSQYGSEVETLAIQLHTRVYLDKGYISPAELNPVGLYTDEYTSRSRHIYAVNGVKVAAARQISCRKPGVLERLRLVKPQSEAGILSLPTTKNFEIDPDLLCEAAKVSSLADIKPDEVVEISGLASRRKEGSQLGEREGGLDAVLALYSKMLAVSLEQGHKVWIQNVDRTFLRLLKNLVGEDQLKVLGPEREYMGPPTVPVAFNVHDAARYVMASTSPLSRQLREHFREVFAGMSDKRLPPDLGNSIKNEGITLNEYPQYKRRLTDPKFLALTAIAGYSSVRAFPAAAVNEFHGSVGTLWGIDVATAYPYGWGLIEAATGKNLTRKIGGAVVAAACFVAPYAYFYAKGNEYPGYVNLIAGSLVSAAVGKEALARIIGRRSDARMREGLKATRPL